MKITPAALGITLASLLVAGYFGSIHKDGLDPVQIPARLGKPVELNPGQTMAPLSLSYGQLATTPTGTRSMISPDRIIAMRLQMATRGDRELVGTRCQVLHRDGSVAETIHNEIKNFPEPGFQETGMVLFEVSKEHLVGARLSCMPSGVLNYRENHMVLDLGLDAAEVDKIWNESAYREIAWPEPQLEVLK